MGLGFGVDGHYLSDTEIEHDGASVERQDDGRGVGRREHSLNCSI